MSFNRLKYDTCEYQQELKQSVGTLSYVMSTLPFENCQPCRHELGLVGGNAVSGIKGNMVDLESDLRGQTRILTKCPTRKYTPSNDGFIHNDMTNPINTQPMHLPACQMISYKRVPAPPPLVLDKCGR